MDDSEDPEDESTQQSVSTIHHVLRSFRRRIAIILIAQQVMVGDLLSYTACDPIQSEEAKPILTVSDLAQEIVVIEKNLPETHATGEDYRNVYTSLIQTHLPRLDDVGAITYEKDRKEIYTDKNLLAIVTIVLTSEPVIEAYFDQEKADHYYGGPADNSISE